MAWGLLDRFMRPKWLLDRVLLVAEHIAEGSGEAPPTLLIDTLRERFGAQRVCIHFADPGMLSPETQESFVAACPAASANATEATAGVLAEAGFWQHALTSSKPIAASATPAAIQDALRPVLEAGGVRDAMAIPLTYRGDVYAVVNLYFKRAVPSTLTSAEDVLRSIRLLGNLVYGALLQEYHASALRESDNVTLAQAQAAAARDGYADGHVALVCALAVALGDAAGLSRTEQEALRTGAMLRDIGKLHVPDYILQKPGPLDAEERACVHEHPVTGARLLLEADFVTDAGHGVESASRTLSMVASIVRSHHERLDGSGYPDGLTGAAVPVLARIVAIADVYAALVADRPYRAALPAPRAVQALQEMAGPALDPALVSLFLARGIPAAVSSELSGPSVPAKVSRTVTAGRERPEDSRLLALP